MCSLAGRLQNIMKKYKIKSILTCIYVTWLLCLFIYILFLFVWVEHFNSISTCFFLSKWFSWNKLWKQKTMNDKDNEQKLYICRYIFLIFFLQKIGVFQISISFSCQLANIVDIMGFAGQKFRLISCEYPNVTSFRQILT